jgi:hypothetical protein
MTRITSTSRRALAKLPATAAIFGFFLMLLVGCSKKDSDKKLVAPATVDSAAASKLAAAKPSPEACHQCETSGPCAELSKGCNALSGNDRTACEAVDKCIETTGCAKADKSFTSCFCGAITTDACLAAPVKGNGAPVGACADVMRQTFGAGVASNHDILVSFQRPETTLGAAITRRNCQKGTECRVVCGY